MPEETLPNRQSIRCKGWDYNAPGWYFLTFNTKARRPVFGTIVNGRMALNAAGRIAAEEWQKSAEIRPNLVLDAFVVMPDHVHGIVRIVATEGDLPDARTSRGDQQVARQQPPRLLPRSLGAMVAGFKGAVGKRVNVLQGTPGAALWHRNYWDVIVRDDLALARIRAYIRDNPSNAHAVLQSGPPRLLGNPALLQRPRLGFLASRGDSTPHGKLSMQPGEAILSGFLSPMERAVFRAGLAARRPMIWVKSFGLTQGGDSAAIQTAIAEDRLLILSPFDDTIDEPSARRAVWVNHYVIANSTRLVVGHLNPDGMLACLLCETPPDLEIQYLKEPA